jgi:O-antigen/teichoic acid export membrane protein
MGSLKDTARQAWALARGFERGLLSDEAEGSVAQKSVRGGVWILLGSGSMRLLQVVQTAILARLLVPADFGLMRLVLVATSAVGAFSNLGIGAALVQRPDMNRRFMDTAWTMDLGRNLFMFAGIFLIARSVAAFYHEPMLADMLRVVALKFVFFGLSNNSGMAMLLREMRYRRRQLYEVCLNAVGIAVTLTLAFWLRSVWALVYAELYYGFGEMVGSYIVYPFRPRFRIYWREAGQLFSFGKHLFVAGILGFLHGSLDSALLGKLLGTEALGYYSLAGSLVATPVAIVGSAFGVLFPAFSRIQADLEALRRAVLRSLGIAVLAVAPMLVGIAVTATPLVEVLYSVRYLPAVPLAIAFCAVRLLAVLEWPLGSLLNARGKPYLNNVATLVHLAAFVPLLFVLAPAHGALGVLAALGLATLGECAYRYWTGARELQTGIGPLVEAVARPLGAAALMGGGVWALKLMLEGPAPTLLTVLVPCGVLLYVLACALVNRTAAREVGAAIAKAAHSQTHEAVEAHC